MGITYLTDTVRLRRDKRQLMPEILGERIDSNGEKIVEWKHTGTFHTTVEGAIKHLCNVILVDKDYKTLKDYLDDYLKTERELLSRISKRGI